MKNIKRILILFSTLLLMISLGSVVYANNNESEVVVSDALVQNAKSAILIELTTGKVLYEYNSHAKSSPASMTKILSLKLVFDALKSKRISLDQVLTTSENASGMGGSQIFLSVNEKMKVSDLLKSMVIASANDATIVLAEAISGTESNFVKAMNDEIAKLGLKDTSFVDATGLSDDNHYSSCYDISMLARHLLLNHETDVLPLSSTYESYVRENTDSPFWLVNTNKLVKHVDGVDGLKTGWTSKAGYCLTCTKQENGMRLISVVMGCDSVTARTKDTVALLNYGFANFEKHVVIPKGTEVEEINNLEYNPHKIRLITKDDFTVITEKGTPLKDYSIEEKIDYQALSELKSNNIGQLQITFSDGEIVNIQLIAHHEYKKASFWDIILNILNMIF